MGCVLEFAMICIGSQEESAFNLISAYNSFSFAAVITKKISEDKEASLGNLLSAGN